MSEPDALLGDWPQQQQAETLCLLRETEFSLGEEWIEVQCVRCRLGVGLGALTGQSTIVGSGPSSATTLDDAVSHVYSAIPHARSEQCISRYDASSSQESENIGTVRAMPLEQELQLTRAEMQSLHQRYVECQQRLKALEDRVTSEQNGKRSDCDCTTAFETPHDTYVDDAASAVSDSSSDAPTILRDYFNNARIAFIQNERLHELDAEHDEKLSSQRSENECDAGSIHHDETFERTYRLRRQKFSEALAVASHEAEALKQACLVQGIDPEHHRYRTPSDRSVARDVPDQLFGFDVQHNGPKALYDSVIGWLQHKKGP